MVSSMRSVAAVVVATALLMLGGASVAMADETAPPPPPTAADLRAAPTASPVDSKGGVGATTYDDCLDGRACVFEGWGGSGLVLTMTRCGWINIAPYNNFVSSARTHGNPEWLWDVEANAYSGYIPRDTMTNLSMQENDRADYVYVDCR